MKASSPTPCIASNAGPVDASARVGGGIGELPDEWDTDPLDVHETGSGQEFLAGSGSTK